jgi:predicted outer membrane repeat protein
MNQRSHRACAFVTYSISLVCLGGFLTGVPSTARAAGVVGTGTAASCTDAALDAALAGGGLVTFNCGGPVMIDISMGTGTKTINADTTIDGGALITISGGSSVRVFTVNSGVNFTVRNLTIANGRADQGSSAAMSSGGGISFSDNGNGKLTVTNSAFTGNSAAGYGGAIASSATLMVTNSAFAGNSAATADGFAGQGGAIWSNGPLTVTNSTFAGNSAGDDSATYRIFGTDRQSWRREWGSWGLSSLNGRRRVRHPWQSSYWLYDWRNHKRDLSEAIGINTASTRGMRGILGSS